MDEQEELFLGIVILPSGPVNYSRHVAKAHSAAYAQY